jgi:RNA polymerase sigma factor (sigma-70 family)
MRTAGELIIEASDEAIWAAHSDELVRYARVLVGRDDAYDVVATAYLRASRGGWEGVREPRPYLFRAVTNEAHNHRRQRERRWRRDTNAVLATTTPSTDDLIDVRREVERLSVRQRSVVYLAYWRDMSEHDIAQLLDLSVSTVHRHLERARTHLRKALG